MELTVQTVLDWMPELANLKPSKFVSPLASRIFTIAGTPHEFRLGVFVCPRQSTTLQKVVTDENIGDMVFSIRDEGYGPVLFFLEPKKLKKQGIFIRLSLRALSQQ